METLEKSFPELLTLPQDLFAVKEASKVNSNMVLNIVPWGSKSIKGWTNVEFKTFFIGHGLQMSIAAIKSRKEFIHHFIHTQASLSELDSEVSVLREGLKGVEKELSFHKSRNEGGQADPKDKFVNVISEFVTVASCKFSDLEDAVKDMKVEVGIRMSGWR